MSLTQIWDEASGKWIYTNVGTGGGEPSTPQESFSTINVDGSLIAAISVKDTLVLNKGKHIKLTPNASLKAIEISVDTIGDLASLTTTSKSNIVYAINEVKEDIAHIPGFEGTITPTQIDTTTIKIKSSQIEDLILGTNVAIGSGITIPWSHVTDQPSILTSNDVKSIIDKTYITSLSIAIPWSNLTGVPTMPSAYTDVMAVAAWNNSIYASHIDEAGLYSGDLNTNKIQATGVLAISSNSTIEMTGAALTFNGKSLVESDVTISKIDVADLLLKLTYSDNSVTNYTLTKNANGEVTSLSDGTHTIIVNPNYIA